MSVLNKSFLHKLKNNIIFFIIYSLLFLVVIKTFGYIAPFFIGGLLAFIINPLSQKLERKFKINKGISTLFLSILGVALVIFIASILVVKGSHQLVEFLNDIDSNSYSYFGTMVNDWIDNLSKYMDYIQGISNNSINVQDLVSRYGNNLANIAKSMYLLPPYISLNPYCVKSISVFSGPNTSINKSINLSSAPEAKCISL